MEAKEPDNCQPKSLEEITSETIQSKSLKKNQDKL